MPDNTIHDVQQQSESVLTSMNPGHTGARGRSDTVNTTETARSKRPQHRPTTWPIASSYHLHDEPYCQIFDPRPEYGVQEKRLEDKNTAGANDVEAAPKLKANKTWRQSVLNLFKQSSLPAEEEKSSSFRTTSTIQEGKGYHVVCWDGEDDPENPKNWKLSRKWSATVLVSLFTFMAPFSSSMIAPCLDQIALDFSVTDKFEETMMLSIFILAFAVGPLIFGPLSEIFGRVRMLQATNCFYLIFNLACGCAQNSTQMMAFRFLAGLGGSAPSAISSGVLGDCWRPEERGMSTAANSLIPLIAPALGPIAGGYIAQHMTWRWVFWISSIMDVVIQLLGVFLLKETYAPTLLQKKANQLRKQTGDEQYVSKYDLSNENMPDKLAETMLRPLHFLATQPIMQCLALFVAYVYGLTFIVYATFSELWTDRYGESMGVSGLHYLAPTLGFAIGAQFLGPLNDVVYKRLKRSYNGVARPEFRTLIAIPGSIFIMIGLFWYGWSAQAK